MNTEKVKLYDLGNNLVDVIEIPKRAPEQMPRRIVHRGKKYREGGGDGAFYNYCEFSEVAAEKDA